MDELQKTLKELEAERLQLLIQFRETVLSYGKQIGAKRALGVAWSSREEERRLAELLDWIVMNLNLNLTEAVAIYPADHARRTAEAEAAQEMLDEKLWRIMTIIEEGSEEEEVDADDEE